MAAEPFDPNDIEALERRLAELKAEKVAPVAGSGAIAQGDSNALGERAVMLGDNLGTVVTGIQFVANYCLATGEKLSKEELARQVTGYLRWLQERCGSIELRGIERAGGAPIVVLPLETAYVALRASRWRHPTHEKDIPIDRVLTLGNRLAIIGGPGSGKTTVLLHLAWALASSLLTGESDLAHSRLGLKIEPSKLPLPIFVPLASFARYRRSLPPHVPARERTLAHFISYHLISKQADFALPEDFFLQILNLKAATEEKDEKDKDRKDVILLLDGLDEVANEDERAEVRQAVEDLVRGREHIQVVATCRTVTYRSGRTALGADFREIDVQPLDAEQHIAPMVRQAYASIYPHDGVLRAERSADLLNGIARLEAERRARLGKAAERLVSSPLMVRLLLIVHFNNRTLPDERADLFDKAISALLQVDYGREESDIRELSKDWTLYRDIAQHLAYHMHSQGPDQGREIDEAALKKALSAEEEFKPYIGAFLGHARQRGSVLEERGGAYRFIHLAFQEFLAARYLREVTGGDSLDAVVAALQSRLDDPWWREPVLLLAGYWGTKAPKPARAFLTTLFESGKTPNGRFSAAELAATAALEWRDSGEAIRTECAHRIVALLNDADALAGSKPVIRARAGDALSRLGDPRFDPERFYLPADNMLGFVRIPADPEFRIGTHEADVKRVGAVIGCRVSDDEINDVPTPSPEFYIARFPVTVAQFRAFVKASGFRPGDEDALRDPHNRPVRHVTWREADAYCQWLNEAITSLPMLQGSKIACLVGEHGWRIALPSELEWERAARGGLRDAVFSWGDEPDANRANYGDSRIGSTSAVGCFPANTFDLHDMIGNVLEWTCSRLAAYPYVPDDSREDPEPNNDDWMVLRGGAWGYSRDGARCAYRDGLSPDFLDDHGFRLVLRVFPVS
jgi:formylglycine-generating enzyme required for sulfatase activity